VRAWSSLLHSATLLLRTAGAWTGSTSIGFLLMANTGDYKLRTSIHAVCSTQRVQHFSHQSFPHIMYIDNCTAAFISRKSMHCHNSLPCLYFIPDCKLQAVDSISLLSLFSVCAALVTMMVVECTVSLYSRKCQTPQTVQLACMPVAASPACSLAHLSAVQC
jgi:hypothetical protein